MATAQDNCHKQTLSNIVLALAKKAGTLIAKFLCSQLQLLAGTVKSFLQAELTILEPVVELESVFIENFVVFPLDAAIKVSDTVSNTLSKPLNDAGIDKSCPSHKNIHEQLDKAAAPAKATSRTLKSARDAAQAEVDAGKKRIDDLNKAISALDDFFNIQCP